MPSEQHNPPTHPTESAISSIKVFSATKQRDRELLGDRVSEWLAANPQIVVLDTVVSQSSDCSYHCLSLVLICAEH